MSSTCSNCGAINSRQVKFCTVCGAAIQPQVSKLPSQIGQKRLDPTVLIALPGAGGAEIVLENGMRYPLASPTFIGRDSSQCQIVLDQDTMASRCHARLDERSGSWTVTDPDSSNGTYVNGLRIQSPTPVRPGERIAVGNTSFTISLPGVQPANPLALVPPGLPAPAIPPVSPPAPVAGWGQPLAVPSPPGGWRVWKQQPITEGYVRYISERYMVKKDDLWEKGCMAAAIGFFVAPFLAFLPFLSGNDMPARDLRIEDAQSGCIVDVKIIGEIMGNINLGDAIAVWGQNRQGLLLVTGAFNYETQSDIQIKKV